MILGEYSGSANGKRRPQLHVCLAEDLRTVPVVADLLAYAADVSVGINATPS